MTLGRAKQVDAVAANRRRQRKLWARLRNENAQYAAVICPQALRLSVTTKRNNRAQHCH
jgi:hypothetical protein